MHALVTGAERGTSADCSHIVDAILSEELDLILTALVLWGDVLTSLALVLLLLLDSTSNHKFSLFSFRLLVISPMVPTPLSEVASQLETLCASRSLDPVALSTPPLRIHPLRARPHALQCVKALSESIAPTLVALDELQLQLDAIRRETLLQLAQHLNALSQINSLPPELMREIFGFAVSSPDEKLALTLAQVCQRWRAIALQQRGLWSTVEAEWSLQLQNISMDRSGSSPIDFVIGTGVPPSQLIPTWVPRIEHLTVYDSSPLSLWSLPDITPDNQGFPALENLYIVGMYIQSTLGLAQTPMPRLRALWLSTRAVINIGAANGANLTFLSLDLRNASFQCPTPRHGRRIKSLLDCCPRLQQLWLDDWYNCEASDIEETGVVLLDYLDYLALSDFHDIVAAATLRMIKAPNLSKLLLENVSTRCCYGHSGAELGDCCMTGDWSIRSEIHRKVGTFVQRTCDTQLTFGSIFSCGMTR